MTDSPVATGKSLDHVEVLIGLGEGPIKGLATGDLKSFYFGETPVMNGDGSMAFDNTTITIYPGDPNPDPIQMILGGQSNSTTVGVQLSVGVPVTRTTSGGIMNAIDVRIVANNVGTDQLKGTTVSFLIEYKRSTSPTWLSWGVQTLNGQFQSKVFEYRFAVDPTTLGQSYDIRITKQTADSTSKNFTDIQWESFQEISTSDLSFPNTAMAQINSQVSNQFSSLPEFSGIYDGFLCRMPSNFDPYTHTFTGVWDGTFKVDWTNDPVWILYETVMNTTWGVNRYYPCVIDKYDCYAASSQVTSVLVDDGEGGLQPRYTFNRVIKDPVDGMDLLNLIAGSFNARCVDDQNGTIMLLVDKQDDAVKLFTPEMVEGGIFNYQYTDLNQRYNRITAKFPNPDLNWAEDRRLVWNQDSIDAIGEVPLDYQMEDCTNVHEAIRRTYFRIMSAVTEKEQVSFRTNRMGCTVQVFEVILVADPDMGYGITRRISSVSSDHKTIYFDDPIPLEAGLTYTINFQTPNGLLAVPFYSPLTQTYASLTWTTALDSVIDAPLAFSVGNEYGDAGLPKPYRVLSITETEGNSDKVDILAIEVNRNKYDAADNATFAENVDYSNRKVSNTVDPPTNFTYDMQQRTEAGVTHNYLTLGWTDSNDDHFSRYRVEFEFNGASAQLLTETVNDTCLFVDPPPGTYVFYIYAMNTLSYASSALVGTVAVGAAAVPPPSPVTGLEIAGQGTDEVFTTLDVMFDWRLNSSALNEDDTLSGSGQANRDSTFRNYLLTFYDTVTGVEFLQDTTENTFYNLSYSANYNSKGGPHRYITVYVQYQNIYGQLSTPSVLRVFNPAPPAVTNLGKAPSDGPGLINVVWDPSPEPDVAGYLLFVSPTSGFTPGPTNQRYDGKDNKYVYSREAASTVYVRVAAYDAFDKTTYTLSPEVALTVPFIGTDFFGLDSVPRAALASDVQSDISRALIGLASVGSNDQLSIDTQLKTLSQSIVQIATNLLQLDTKVREAGIETDPVTGATSIYSVQSLTGVATGQAQALSLLSAVTAQNATVTRSATAPTGAAVGDLWSNSTDDLVYRWDGAAWVFFGGLAGTVYTHSQQLTVLSNTVNDPVTGMVATATLVGTFSSTITSQGSAISANSSAITALQNTVNNPTTGVAANAAAVSSLSSTVSSYSSSISSNSSAITALQNTVNNPTTGVAATASALSSLSSTVSSQGSTISSQGSAITALQNTVNNPTTGVAANASAISSLSSTVSSQGSTISANSGSITTLNSQVGRINASGYLSIQTAATPSGANARVALAVSASSGGSPTSAGIFIDAMTSGVSRIVAIANQFYITDTSNNYNPFYFSGGTLYVDNAVITNLQAGNIGTAAVKDYHIDTGQVTTVKIDANAVTNAIAAAGGSTTLSLNTWTTICSIVITTVGGRILVSFNDYITWSTNGPRGHYQIINELGTQIAYTGYGGGSCPDFICSAGSGVDNSVGAGSHTYYLQCIWEAGANAPTCAAPRMTATELKR